MDYKKEKKNYYRHEGITEHCSTCMYRHQVAYMHPCCNCIYGESSGRKNYEGTQTYCIDI